MAGIARPGMAGRKASNMPPPAVRSRPSIMRSARDRSITPALGGRSSPADPNISKMLSPGSQVGAKRKREFDVDAGMETNINVVVRCRGRNEREVRENSGVVFKTNGIKGNTVELSMGPTALNHKTYNFDKVFSPAADQTMIFDEVVAPILDEVIAGFNCTIFAYGQTGTGKTYTMSGDISDQLPLPDAAGIIPRVLHELFMKLDGDTENEYSVKCSFIELYNEELRDLLAPDDNAKLKIFEDNSKKGSTATVVQGMEESHIKSSLEGIKKLKLGSHKRQVAATKCNDLSSRSHTVFTITVLVKRPSDSGEEYVGAGKLNLVDLAGSENIQRSGAENKRAAEAGLINKSLLTLGRVINALVEKSLHIPYRESKLTRLLQDSLGGQTKTCIIATLSPAKSNLEETISTLDYAFRAKNIRNKPQLNQPITKKTLFREFTTEIERLKMELIATRQRNGVYLTEESYEELKTVSESRRLLSEEQQEKIETLEINLRNKIADLFSTMTDLNALKKDNEAVKVVLDGTKGLLEKTEIVLDHTKQSLAEETMLRKVHEQTEGTLANIGMELISTLGRTASDVGGLHSKLRRRSALHTTNKDHWLSLQNEVSQTTLAVDARLCDLQVSQQTLIAGLSSRMRTFVEDELQKLSASQKILSENSEAFKHSQAEVNDQTSKTRDEMNTVLEEVVHLRENVKEKVGEGLSGLSDAAQTISAGIATEIESFQTQLHSSYASLGRDFKTTFDDLLKQLDTQQDEANQLRRQIIEANAALVAANRASSTRLAEVVARERQVAMSERKGLYEQMSSLIEGHAAAQDARMATAMSAFDKDLDSAANAHELAQEDYVQAWDLLAGQTSATIVCVNSARDAIKARVQGDFAIANMQVSNLQSTTSAVHDSTTRIVSQQLSQLDTQLQALDDIVSRVRNQNDTHHSAHITSLATLSSSVQATYDNMDAHLAKSYSRVRDLGAEVQDHTIKELEEVMAQQLGSDADIRAPLGSLRANVQGAKLDEYKATGQTPQRTTYEYPRALPRTGDHEMLVAKFRRGSPVKPATSEVEITARELGSNSSPSKTSVFTDLTSADIDLLDKDNATMPLPSFSSSLLGARPALFGRTGTTGSLRELDLNTLHPNGTAAAGATAASEAADVIGGLPPLKRQNTTGSYSPKSARMAAATAVGGRSAKTRSARMTFAADRENLTVPVNFSASVGHGSTVAGGRRRGLRSQGTSA